MNTLVEIVVLLIVAIAIDLLCAVPIMWLWNWIMPSLFGLTTLTYWQTWGFATLVSILTYHYQPKRKD